MKEAISNSVRSQLLLEKLEQERDSFDKCIPFWNYDVNPITMLPAIRERKTIMGMDEILPDYAINRIIGG